MFFYNNMACLRQNTHKIFGSTSLTNQSQIHNNTTTIRIIKRQIITTTIVRGLWQAKLFDEYLRASSYGYPEFGHLRTYLPFEEP